MLTHVLRLQCGAVLGDEVVGRSGPRRQHHVVDKLAVLPTAQGQPLAVDEDIGEVEKLGHQLLQAKNELNKLSD